VITGGGTGGHIYPGLAIAQEIKNIYPGLQIHFVGAQGGLEEKILPKYDFPFHLIKIGRLHSSVGRAQQIKTLLMMPLSLWHAFKIFWSIKPEVVLGVGGFASGPFLFIAWLCGARTAIWEANAYPGLANRWLAKVVDVCFVVFPEATKFLPARNVIDSGMPVRQEFFEKSAADTVRGSKLKILVFGGSQGARAINNAMVSFLKKHGNILDQVEIKHQTGGRDFERIKQEYGPLASWIEVVEYIHDMPNALRAADIVICRSGASTVAEVIACKKPAIFIPLPTAADDHQLKNAQVVVNKKGGFLLEQKDLSDESLHSLLLRLLRDRHLLDNMSENLEHFDFSKASRKVVAGLFEVK